ncbi:MAG TPA: hypothetical protein VI112_14770 [Bacteroidia bacterium]|jgi:hypothetical protein
MRHTFHALLALFLGANALIARSSSFDNDISAKDIIKKCIDKCGGHKALDTISCIELVYRLSDPAGDSCAVMVKRMEGRYIMSVFGQKVKSKSTIYDHGRAVQVTEDGIATITDSVQLDALMLQTFLYPELGFEKLNYKLERLPDHQFEYFNCYVVKAISPHGYVCTNYYDKSSARCVVTMYEGGDKTVFASYGMSGDVLIYVKLLNVDRNGTSVTSVKSVFFNSLKDTSWFGLPNAFADVKNFRTGTFYDPTIENYEVTRTEDKQFEVVNGKKKFDLEVTRKGDLEYSLYNGKSVKGLKKGDPINVLIVNWNKDSYYFFYDCKAATGTAMFKKRW